jgi:hypothetical protein
MAIYDGSIEQMLGCVDISLEGYSSSIIFFSNHTRLKIPRNQQITATHFHAYLSNNNLANNFPFFFLLARTNISSSCNSSSPPDLYCSRFASRG